MKYVLHLVIHKRNHYMPVVEQEHRHFQLLKPKNLILALFVVSAAVGVAVAVNFHLARTACSNPFTGSILNEAARSLDQSKQVQLQSVVKTIRAKHNFDRDPNCMYVVVSYDIYTSNITSARDDLNKLKQVYNAKQGLDAALGKTESIATYENYVDVLERAYAGDVIQSRTIPNI